MHSDPIPAARLRHDGDPILRRITGALLILAGACAGAAIVLLVLPSATGSGLSPARLTGAAPEKAAAQESSGSRGAPGPAATAGAPAASPVLAAGDGYSAIAKSVMPAVVNISSLHVIQTYERYSPFGADPFFQQFFGGGMYDYVVPRERREMSLGSGVIVDDRGTILTNHHVVEQATEVRVALSDGRELPAKILGVD
ncbi:MAG TPA: trypsin-like peptidase domain-containing protein, partial [Candidatus Polarisedimenticolia bacterium]|nr:trypsin-like peptidase domain-containing protein [Candidatus Polarisedimenticolia bacterium]